MHCPLMALQNLFPAKYFATHGAGHCLAVAQMHKAHVAPRILSIGVDLPAQLAGHSVRRQVV